MKQNKKLIRRNRTRARIKNLTLPRLTVFRSNKYVYAQIIDDKKARTLVYSSINDVIGKTKRFSKTELAQLVGEKLAVKAKKKGISKIYLDRGSYKYHGVVKALAESVRKGGIDF